MMHIVNSVQLEVTCPDEDMSFNLRQNFAQTLQQQIAEVIDTVCSVYVNEDESIKLDKIELDLGSFSQHTFGTEFKKVLGIKLERELADKLSKIAPAKRQASRQLSHAEILQYFLTNGALPWFADETAVNLDEICSDVLVNQADVSGRFFYRNRFKEIIWKRVAWQLNEQSKELVIGLSAEIQTVKEIFNDWIARLSAKITGLKSSEKQIVLAKMNDVLIANAPAIYSAGNDVKVWAQLFKIHIHTILDTDKTLLAETNQEFENIISARQSNTVPQVIAQQQNKIDPVKKMVAETVDQDAVEKYAVKNAGLVLLSPFLLAFFKELNLLDGEGWKDQQSAFKAVHLLKFLSSGQTRVPEYSMVFEKVLCGLQVDTPVPLEVVLKEGEMEEAVSLLKAVISHWNALKNTSVDGLREAFFKRDGLLTKKDNDWLVQVERKTLDVLLENIPWGYSTISLAWNRYLLFVEW